MLLLRNQIFQAFSNEGFNTLQAVKDGGFNP
jgi:hypothetical protein